jgi:hypothetical protein
VSFYKQPDKELTEQEKLIAALVALEQRIPSGYQFGMPLHLDRAIAAVEALFAEHNLPMRDELVAELTVWRGHAEDGVKFAQQCDHLMKVVIRTVDRG